MWLNMTFINPKKTQSIKIINCDQKSLMQWLQKIPEHKTEIGTMAQIPCRLQKNIISCDNSMEKLNNYIWNISMITAQTIRVNTEEKNRSMPQSFQNHCHHMFPPSFTKYEVYSLGGGAAGKADAIFTIIFFNDLS